MTTTLPDVWKELNAKVEAVCLPVRLLGRPAQWHGGSWLRCRTGRWTSGTPAGHQAYFKSG